MAIIESFAFALEDVFALYLTDFQPGFFVDIGCGHPLIGSNSRLLEAMGWKGICIDASKHPEWDYQRSTKCHVADATQVAYADLFRSESAPSTIDVLSIDVDDACFETLKALPFEGVAYNIVMIEHDFYRTSALRDPERALLISRGFDLVCADVTHEPGKPFEDWWLKADHFDRRLVSGVRSCGEFDIDVIRRFGRENTIIRLSGFNGSYPQTVIG